MKAEVLKSGLVAKRVLCAREVRAPDADAGIADAVAVCARVGSGQESTSICWCHLQEIVASTVGYGIAKAVHLLIGRFGRNGNVLRKLIVDALRSGVFHLPSAVGRCRIDANLFGKRDGRSKKQKGKRKESGFHILLSRFPNSLISLYRSACHAIEIDNCSRVRLVSSILAFCLVDAAMQVLH